MSFRDNGYRSKRSNPFGGMNGFGGGRKRFGNNDSFDLPNIDWRSLNIPPFKKNFYREHPNVQNRPHAEDKKILAELEITVSGNAPKPITTFEESGLPEYIQAPIRRLGFSIPTPIQCQSFPIALSGHDMVGIASTGSGKTLAFLIPAIIHINAQEPLKRGDGPIALVIAPTRELAMQIQQQIPPFADESRLQHAAVYGGVPKSGQIRSLQRGVDIIVATPGRLLDFLSCGMTNLRRVTYLILDEADRMLDMGFERPIRQILSQIRPERQTMLFSATWPKDIQSLADEILRRPVHVNIGSLSISACKNVRQEFDVVEEYNKLMRLLFFLKKIERNAKVLIFVATKVQTDQLSDSLRSNGFYCGSINGDKRQYEREMVMNKFRHGEISILIGTDVASRGIDIKDISVVVNYDFPNTIEDYVHRIGRTGRADKFGRSLTLLTRRNAHKVGGLIELLRNDKMPVPEEVERLHSSNGGMRSGRRFGGGGGGGGRFRR